MEKVKSVAPALLCVGCWLTGEDSAAVAAEAAVEM